ncbi:MAG: ATP-binding protein [bacterium]
MRSAPKILKIRSDKTELKRVEFFLMEIFLQNKLPLQSFNKVLLCVSEAVVNSIDHGNRNDQEKKVNVELKSFTRKRMVIQISDEGAGFNYRNLSNPTYADNIKKETGRGIHIIATLSDEIEFMDKGNCVRFKVNISE